MVGMIERYSREIFNSFRIAAIAVVLCACSSGVLPLKLVNGPVYYNHEVPKRLPKHTVRNENFVSEEQHISGYRMEYHLVALTQNLEAAANSSLKENKWVSLAKAKLQLWSGNGWGVVLSGEVVEGNFSRDVSGKDAPDAENSVWGAGTVSDSKSEDKESTEKRGDPVKKMPTSRRKNEGNQSSVLENGGK